MVQLSASLTPSEPNGCIFLKLNFCPQFLISMFALYSNETDLSVGVYGALIIAGAFLSFTERNASFF